MKLKNICLICLLSINIFSFSQVNCAFADRHEGVLIADHIILTEKPTNGLIKYREQLKLFRNEFSVQEMPDIKFFLFGMANRTKLIYQKGSLINSLTGSVFEKWNIKEETIIPNEYKVSLLTVDNIPVSIYENENGVYINEGGGERLIEGTDYAFKLPSFSDHRYSEILKVLHQELLINVIDSKPVPNYFVYQKPWVRDASLMAMCFEQTGNLHVIKDWASSLDEIYDYNNGEAEGDNLGQTLFLLSLYSDNNNPLVKNILEEAKKREIVTDKGKYISGRTDGSERPAYATKWLKFGLKSMGLPDDYVLPDIDDGYNTLVWWDYKDIENETGNISEHYPYITWARDHYFGRKKNPISNRDYPLTWEIKASAADYTKMAAIDEKYVKDKNSSPHTWHAAEVFLYLTDSSVFDPEKNWSFNHHVIPDSLFGHRLIDREPPENVWIKCSGDFNADGLLDILIGGHNGRTNDLIIWYQNPGNTDGLWIKHSVYEGGDAYGFEGGATGDLDGDGDIDLVLGSYWQHKLCWLENQGEGVNQWKLHELGTPKSGTTYLYDFDKDGKLDIVTRASQKYSGEVGKDVWIWKQNNLTSWTRFSKPIGDGEFFNIGDVDMDGKIDIVFANKWLHNNGNIDVGTWKAYTFTDTYSWLCTFPMIIDLNRDGRNDIVLTPTVWAGEYAKTAWYEAPDKQTAGNWVEHIIEDNIECVTHALGVFDFNCDGTLDVFTAEMNSGEDPDELRIYYNQDVNGNSWEKSVIAVSGSHMNQFIDIDGDGDVDIIGGNHGGHIKPVVELWINNTNPAAR